MGHAEKEAKAAKAARLPSPFCGQIHRRRL